MQSIFTVALPLLATVTTSTASLPFVRYKMQGPPPPVEQKVSFTEIKDLKFVDEKKTAIREVALPKPKEKRLICKGCNGNENATLAFLQDYGIKDRNALATIMGNIKQESNFHANICEGGSRINYYSCRWGGYGLIQWTSANRYHGLGSFARKYEGKPSTLQTQLRYLTTEVQWQRIVDRMKTPGKSIDRYMNYAYSWIGWGIHGSRTQYAYQYANKLITVEV